MISDLTERENQMLTDAHNAAHLRDLYHSAAWEVYTKFARQRIDQLLKEYMREDLSRDQILEAHMRLQAVTKFQVGMEELVKGAVEFVTPEGVRDMILQARVDVDV